MDRIYSLIQEVINTVEKKLSNSKGDSYNDINNYEMGPSTMKNLDDLYGDDESNTMLNNTNAMTMMDHVNGIYGCMAALREQLKDNSTHEKLTNAGWHDKIQAMYHASCEMQDFVMNQPLADDDKTMESSQSGGNPGLWDHIRKKKEKLGKKYRPAKPGDKNRPDPEQWKKLTK